MQDQKNAGEHDKMMQNRRKHPRESDRLFRFLVGINVLGWLVFLSALVVFHYARPEFVSGLQAFWGITGRQEWAPILTLYLIGLLAICVVISLTVLFLKRRRNRREHDYYGINGYVLMFTALSSLIILYFQLNS